MNRHNDDDFDDDDDDDFEDDQFDEDGVLKPGRKLKVSLDMMDSVQRSVAENWNGNRPGWRVPARAGVQDQVIEDAHAEYRRFLRTAHRAADAKPTEQRRRPASLADARAAADAARLERDQWMRDAHKNQP